MSKKYGVYICTGCGIGDVLDMEDLVDEVLLVDAASLPVLEDAPIIVKDVSYPLEDAPRTIKEISLPRVLLLDPIIQVPVVLPFPFRLRQMIRSMPSDPVRDLCFEDHYATECETFYMGIVRRTVLLRKSSH